MKDISVVILSKNEEKNIEACLHSVAFCDEVILLDDYSSDTTVQIAQQKNVKVIQRKLEGDFAAQRNFGMEQAKHDWILFVDADERVSPGLQKEIQQIEEIADVTSYYIPRRDFWWGTELKYGEVMKARKKGFIRLVKKKSGLWEGSVHEAFITDKPSGRLFSFIDHYPHQTVAEFIHEINIYSSLRARQLQKTGKKSGLFSILSYPFFKFLLVYVVYRGFLDGPAGFAYAFLMSFHSFLVRAKLYQFRNLS